MTYYQLRNFILQVESTLAKPTLPSSALTALRSIRGSGRDLRQRNSHGSLTRSEYKGKGTLQGHLPKQGQETLLQMSNHVAKHWPLLGSNGGEMAGQGEFGVSCRPAEAHSTQVILRIIAHMNM